MARYARIKGRLGSQAPPTGYPCPDLPSVGERHHLYTRESHASKTQKKVTKGKTLQGTTYHQNAPKSHQDSILEPLSAVRQKSPPCSPRPPPRGPSRSQQERSSRVSSTSPADFKTATPIRPALRADKQSYTPKKRKVSQPRPTLTRIGASTLLGKRTQTSPCDFRAYLGFWEHRNVIQSSGRNAE